MKVNDTFSISWLSEVEEENRGQKEQITAPPQKKSYKFCQKHIPKKKPKTFENKTRNLPLKKNAVIIINKLQNVKHPSDH